MEYPSPLSFTSNTDFRPREDGTRSVETQLNLQKSTIVNAQPQDWKLPCLASWSIGMSSFGAMARAAEYAAATNAKQRQVSREAEEQKLPPKAAPVSLSAFTRTQQPSRNKGTKQWKPLTMDDMVDSTRTQCESPGRESPSPMPHPTRHIATPPLNYPSSRRADPMAPIPVHYAHAIMHSSLPPVFHHPPQFGIPSHMSPLRPYPPRFVPTPYQGPIEGFHNNPIPTYPSSFYRSHQSASDIHTTPVPTEPRALRRDSRRLGPPFSAAVGATPPSQRHQITMIGTPINFEEISPTKQEEKFARMRYMHGSNLPSRVPSGHGASTDQGDPSLHQSQAGAFETGTDLAGSIHYQSLSPSHHLSDSISGDHTLDTTLSRHCGRMGTREVHLGDNLAAGSRRDSLSRRSMDVPGAPLASAQPYFLGSKVRESEHSSSPEISRRMSESGESRSSHRLSTFNKATSSADTKSQGAPPTELSTSQDEEEGPTEPKDPIRYAYIKDSPSPWRVVVANEEQRQIIIKSRSARGLNAGDSEKLAAAINNPAPGLQPPQFVQTEQNEHQALPEEIQSDITLPAGFEQWCKLKQPTEQDRRSMLRLMAQTEKDMGTPGQCFDFVVGSDQAENRIMEATNTDKRIREYVRSIAALEARKKTHEAKMKHNGKLPADFDDGFRSSMILGDVILNVGSYFDSRKADGVPNDSFTNFKAVPEYAIERTGLLPSLRHHSSYFDDVQEGFHQAPARIARDPRFRP